MGSQAADSSESFPLKISVWPGLLLASVAHAVFVARAPSMAHEQSWDGQNYNVQDSEGSRGTIAFGEDKNCFVAVFYLETSARNPLKRDGHGVNEATAWIRGVPCQLKALSQEALQYVLQDVASQAVPVITAAFWSDVSSSRVTAGEPWPDVVKHGAILLKNQMLPADLAIKQWAADFEFTAAQTAFIDALFKRRLATAGGVLQLTPAEAQQVREMAAGDAGVQACRESLGEIGIVMP